MALSTYLELKARIEGLSKRNDLGVNIDTFIDLAESDMWQNLKVREMEARATATVNTSTRFLSLPDDFLRMRKLVLISGATQYPLLFSNPESLQVENASGRPRAFTVSGELEFDRVPDSEYTAEMHYYKDILPLDATNSTNDLLTNYPTVYLYGAMFHYAQWAHDDRMLLQYSDLFDEAMKRANKVSRKARHGPAPYMRPEGSTP